MSLEYEERFVKPCGTMVSCTRLVTGDDRELRPIFYVPRETHYLDHLKATTIAKAVMGLFHRPSEASCFLWEEGDRSFVIVDADYKLKTVGSWSNGLCLSLVLMDESSNLVFAMAVGPLADYLFGYISEHSSYFGSRVNVKKHRWFWKRVACSDGCIVGGMLFIQDCEFIMGPKQKDNNENWCSRIDMNMAAVEKAWKERAVVFNAIHQPAFKDKHYPVTEPMTLGSVFKGLFLEHPCERSLWLLDAKLNTDCPVVDDDCGYCCQKMGYMKCVYVLCPLDLVEEEMEAKKVFDWAVDIAMMEKPYAGTSLGKAMCFEDLTQQDKIRILLIWYRVMFWMDGKEETGCPQGFAMMKDKYRKDMTLPKPLRLTFSQL